MTRAEECEHILQIYGADLERVRELFEQQLRTLQNRAQLLLGVCGVVISANALAVTGKILKGITSPFVLLSGVLVMAAASLIVVRVLRIRWVSRSPAEEPRAWVISNLAYRDAKTRSYRASIVLLLLSMLTYQLGIVLALL